MLRYVESYVIQVIQVSTFSSSRHCNIFDCLYTESRYEHRQYVYQNAAFCATNYTMPCFENLTLREHKAHCYKVIQFTVYHRIQKKGWKQHAHS